MRLWSILIAIALLATFAMPAQADRLEDIQERVSELAQQRILISNEILRLEGAFRERQEVIAEEAARLKAETQIEADKIATEKLAEEVKVKLKEIDKSIEE